MTARQLEGEKLKAAAHATLEERREPYLLAARRALLEVLLDRGSATVDDIRAAVALPAGVGPKLFGAVPKPLAAAGIIRDAGFRRTKRREAHEDFA